MTQTAVYRHYDADGQLLYVGISSRPLRRGYEHSISAHWAERVSVTKQEWFESRAEAAAAERKAIRAERPIANQRGGNASSNQITILLDSWPSRKQLANEIGARTQQVHKWAKFGRIPSQWMLAVLNAAQRRGLAHVTAEWMLKRHARGRSAA